MGKNYSKKKHFMINLINSAGKQIKGENAKQ